MKKEKKDIFDTIMHLPGIKKFEPFYIKHKEVIMYLFFGGLAFFLNMFLFIGMDRIFKINELVNNIICWIICVLFQFLTNRTWVFDGHVDTQMEYAKQMISFFGGRIFTLIAEEIILALFITQLGFNSIIVKLIAQVVVIFLNYIISKLLVFKK